MRFVYSGIATAAEQTQPQKSFKYIDLQHNRLSADDGRMSESGKLEMTCPEVPPSLVWSVLEHQDPQPCRALLWKLLFCCDAWSPIPDDIPLELPVFIIPAVGTDSHRSHMPVITWLGYLPDLVLLCSLYKHIVAFLNLMLRSLFFKLFFSCWDLKPKNSFSCSHLSNPLPTLICLFAGAFTVDLHLLIALHVRRFA